MVSEARQAVEADIKYVNDKKVEPVKGLGSAGVRGKKGEISRHFRPCLDLIALYFYCELIL